MKQKRTEFGFFAMKPYIHRFNGAQDIKELPANQRPREKLQLNGPTALSDLELLAILIGSGTTRQPALMLAQKVLDVLDRLRGDDEISPKELLKISGMGTAKATLICAALELGRRRLPSKRKQVIFPTDVFPLIRHYGNRPQEYFLCISLNGAHEIISVRVISIGLVNHTLVHPREVFA